MSYRYLPWTRRGLAAEVSDADPGSGAVAQNATIPVRLRLNTGADATPPDLRLYGPGDVVGVDPRAIVRLEPRRLTHDAEPDKMAAIEFDPPDFPWLFTPAAPGPNERLRPWCVLVVVEQRDGVRVEAPGGGPLPRLVIESPAAPGEELPDLADSWGFAHSQLLEDGDGGDVAARLAERPNLNVSRIVCPRRLHSGRDWYACVVPAFEAGRRAGLGQGPESGATTAPAWASGQGAPASLTLPVYFHWEFRTGPAGDFEALARRLHPRPVPDGVGLARIFLGAADRALPALAPDAPGAILDLEGALRAPEAGEGSGIDDVPAQLRSDLERLLEAPARHVEDGADPDAEAVAPPLYGQWHARQHEIPEERPRWFRELNLDPRQRANAGLGGDVVRDNQEAYMDAAWRQVGDIVPANRLLNFARLAREVASRVHERHIAGLDPGQLLQVTAPAHARLPLEDRTALAVLGGSVLPPGTSDPSFRRMTSPQSALLKRAARLGGARGGPGGGVAVQVVDELAEGKLALDPAAGVPDGLVTSRLVDEARLGSRTGDTPVALGAGLPEVPADEVRRARELAGELAGTAPEPLRVRPDIALSGIVLDAQLASLAETRAGALPEAETVPLVLDVARRNRDAPAFAVELLRRPAAGGVRAEAIVVDAQAPASLPPPVRDRAVIERFTDAFEAHLAAAAVVEESIVPAPVTLELADLGRAIVTATDPVPVIAARVTARVSIGGTRLADLAASDLIRIGEDLDPVLAFPHLDRPAYEDLKRHDQDRLLPGIGRIPADTVTLLETNPRFVEAYLVGMNHEMNREELWRGFPTDRRGTPFQHFWDRVDGAPDIPLIHRFDANLRLGANALGDPRGSLVLLVRGDLLRRYPNAVVYATPAGPTGRLDPHPTTIEMPVFGGRLDPDVTFAGFDLTREDIEPEPGWLFVIQEQPTEPRFGLDTPPDGGAPGPLDYWSDASWGHAGVDPGEHLGLGAGPLAGKQLPLVEGSAVRAAFATNSAHFAAIAFQRPFQAVISSKRVLAGVEPKP